MTSSPGSDGTRPAHAHRRRVHRRPHETRSTTAVLIAHDSINERSNTMDWTLEVVLLPVSDIDRSVAFYRDQLGFNLDHDTTNEHMHVVQLTPRGSGCSIVIGNLPSQTEMAPGSMRGLQLVVADATAA